MALAAERALYTHDESQLMADRLRDRGAMSIIVCSSAVHLPRAAEHYRRLGFTVTSLPADFATRGAAEVWSWALLIPRGMALAQVDAVAKEWMGRVVTSFTNKATHSNSNSQTPVEH